MAVMLKIPALVRLRWSALMLVQVHVGDESNEKPLFAGV